MSLLLELEKAKEKLNSAKEEFNSLMKQVEIVKYLNDKDKSDSIYRTQQILSEKISEFKVNDLLTLLNKGIVTSYIDKVTLDNVKIETNIFNVNCDNLDIKEIVGIENISNHYEYLYIVLPLIWKFIYGVNLDQSWLTDIIKTFGNKISNHKYEWNQDDIKFNRGALLYILTYSKDYNKSNDINRSQWVMDNYLKFFGYILEAERLGSEKLFNKKIPKSL